MGGPYHLIGRIGSGGMAEVFLGKAVGAAGFQKTVAIKSILPAFTSDSRLTAMLIQEAKVSTRLAHANIVQVLDLGQVGDRYFIVMEHVDGADLDRLLRNARDQGLALPTGIAVWIVRQVLAGLAFVHGCRDERGKLLNLVHRDVSPPNILISRSGEVKLADFGIAKARDQALQTEAGVVRGKAAYMSPEQAYGRELDARSDLFSLGIVLHELLSGQPLFGGESALQTLKKVCEAQVPPPSRSNPAVPAPLDAVALKALAQDRADRFPDARAFEGALEEALVACGLRASTGELLAWLGQAMPPPVIQPLSVDGELLTLGTPPGAPVGATRLLPVGEGSPATAPPGGGQSRPGGGGLLKILGLLLAGMILIGVGGILVITFFRDSLAGLGGTPVAAEARVQTEGPWSDEPAGMVVDGGADAQDGSPADADPGAGDAPAAGTSDPSPADRGRPAVGGPIARGEGTLLVNSEPWARILIDGQDTGVTTPTVDALKLPEGRHLLTLVNPELELTVTAEIVVRKGELLKRFFDLRKEGKQH